MPRDVAWFEGIGGAKCGWTKVRHQNILTASQRLGGGWMSRLHRRKHYVSSPSISSPLFLIHYYSREVIPN